MFNSKASRISVLLLCGSIAATAQVPPDAAIRPKSFYDLSVPYVQRVADAVKWYIVMAEPVDDRDSLVEVEVLTEPDGKVTSFKVLSSKGSPEWERSVKKAMLKLSKLPLDSAGNVPPKIIFTLRP
jgi:TonB family protein